MDPSLLPTTGTTGPTINSPSEASYSSGASHTSSTRSTSSDTSSHRSSPLLDLHHLITTSIVPETNTLVDQPSKMDKTSVPADGINPRRTKFNPERTGPANYQQPQLVRPGAPMSPGNLASRSLNSNNWRIQPMVTDGMYTFDPTNAQGQQQHHFARPTLVHSNSAVRLVQQHHQQQQPPTGLASSYLNDNLVFPDALIDSCYAYCYDRGNGQYTRLIPADMIPTLCDVPALQQDCLGMIVLPAPRALPANGRSTNVEPVMLKTPPPTPTSPTDNIQAHIDTIVGATPRTPTHSHGGNNSTSIASSNSTGPTAPASNMDQQPLPLRPRANNQGLMGSAGGSGGGGGGGGLGDLNSSMHAPANQHHGHGPQAGGGVNHNHHQPQQQYPQRRPKIYCDKWVHEGVCAFTQQGCKYKHEMPFDKLTQHQLGLFHGLPAWWKKHQAELARQRDPVSSSDGEQEGPGPGPAGERLVGAESARGGGFGGRSGAPPAMGGGQGAGAGGNLAWRRPGFSGLEEIQVHAPAHGFGDHPMSGQPGRGGMASNMASHGVSMAQHQRGNPMVPHSPLAWSKSPFGPIAPPTPAPTVHPARGAISTSNPYSSLSNIDESMIEERKGD